MTTILAIYAIVGGAFPTSELGGLVARVAAPGAVVREVVWAADRWVNPPKWAEVAIRGLPAAEVRQALGAPESVWPGSDDRELETWVYVAGSGGGSTRYVHFQVRNGRVVGALGMRATFVPPKWPQKVPGILYEF